MDIFEYKDLIDGIKSEKKIVFELPSDKKDGIETMTIDFDSDKSSININSSDFSSDKSDSDYENEMLKIGVETYDIPAIEFAGYESSASKGIVKKLKDYDYSLSKDTVKKILTGNNTPQTDKEKEAILYKRAADFGYYPAGSFEQINRENGEALSDLFSKNTTWYEKLDAGLSLIDPTGAKANLKNDLNDVRYDLSIKDTNELNPVYGNKKTENDIAAKVKEDSKENSKYINVKKENGRPKKIGELVKTDDVVEDNEEKSEKSIKTDGVVKVEDSKENSKYINVKVEDSRPKKIGELVKTDDVVEDNEEKSENNINTGGVVKVEDSKENSKYINVKKENGRPKKIGKAVKVVDDNEEKTENNINTDDVVDDNEEKTENEIKKYKLHDYDDADDYASMSSTRKTRIALLSEEGKYVNNYYSSGIEEAKKSPIENNYSINIEEENRKLPSVGAIYVAPSITDSDPGLFFKIPLQNNLAFQTMSRVASYNSMSFFNRIGDIKQYSGTGPIEEIEVTTEYFVDGSNDYTMDKLQEIELKYRSLVLPSEYNEDEGSDNPIRYTRPPVIYIVLGKKDSSGTEDSSAYADFNYEKNKVYNNFFTEIKANDNNKLKYRTFVVTRVNINKDTEKYDYYVDATSKEYYDTTGFSVSMQILEIDDNYISGAPSFDDYSKFF